MRINYNVSAMLSNNALANNDKKLAASLERLSSGLKINHGKDNPAGLAMAKRMNAQIESVGVAGRNANDGVSVIEIADGALSEVSEMLQRMNELCVKASTGSMTDEDRQMVQQEISQLKQEIDRVSDTVEFNGQKLLDGTFDLKAYTNEEDIRVSTYSADVPNGKYTLSSLSWSLSADGNSYDVTCTPGSGFPAGMTLRGSMKDGMVTIAGDNGFEMTFDVSEARGSSYSDVEIEATGVGAMRIQIGANEGQVLEINIPQMNLKNMGIEKLDTSSMEGAQKGIESVKGAIQFVSKVRGQLGAFQNRLESTINSLDITEENMTAAYSRIMDVDMAEEMIQYTTNQVLTQAGTSMLAQANERPAQVLQLLQ